jgi:hypothetical protein
LASFGFLEFFKLKVLDFLTMWFNPPCTTRDKYDHIEEVFDKVLDKILVEQLEHFDLQDKTQFANDHIAIFAQL